MTQITLTGAERRALRGEGQLLEAAVQVGREGLTDAVARELDEQLGRQGLIKVRAHEPDRKVRQALFVAMAERSESTLVGTVGRTALLYRPLPEAEQES